MRAGTKFSSYVRQGTICCPRYEPVPLFDYGHFILRGDEGCEVVEAFVTAEEGTSGPSRVQLEKTQPRGSLCDVAEQ